MAAKLMEQHVMHCRDGFMVDGISAPHCVFDEGWPSSDCCREHYRLDCCALAHRVQSVEVDTTLQHDNKEEILWICDDPAKCPCLVDLPNDYPQYNWDICDYGNGSYWMMELFSRAYSYELSVSEKCKEIVKQTCNCGFAKCIFTGSKDGKSACCPEFFKLQCCPIEPTTQEPSFEIEARKECKNKEFIKEICKKCDFYGCMDEVGSQRSVCCRDGYSFRCCYNEPPRITTTTTTTLSTPPQPTTEAAIGPPLWECVLKNACDPSKYGNAKPGRRFRLKKDCQTVEERIKEMPTEQIEFLGNEFTDAQRIGPYFLEEFVPLAQ
ncbi:hypothetical protein niasHT_012061 [Heterodera trifolii]